MARRNARGGGGETPRNRKSNHEMQQMGGIDIESRRRAVRSGAAPPAADPTRPLEGREFHDAEDDRYLPTDTNRPMGDSAGPRGRKGRDWLVDINSQYEQPESPDKVV